MSQPVACPGCVTFVGEALVDAAMFGGTEFDAPKRLCWLCAHFVNHHGATLETLSRAWHAPLNTQTMIDECKCSGEHIYPADVWAKRCEAHEDRPVMSATRAAEPEVVANAAALAGLRSRAMSARERSEKAKAAASKTAAARKANAEARAHEPHDKYAGKAPHEASRWSLD